MADSPPEGMEKTDMVGDPGRSLRLIPVGVERVVWEGEETTRTRGDGLILLVGKVEAILVVGRIPGLVLFRGYELVTIQVVVPVLRLGYFWEPG